MLNSKPSGKPASASSSRGLVRVVAELLVQRRVEAGGGLGEELRGRPGARVQVVRRSTRGRWRSRSPAAASSLANAGLVAPVLSVTGKPTIVPPTLTVLWRDSTSSIVVRVEDRGDVGLAGDDGVGQRLRVGDDVEDDGVVGPLVGVPRLVVLVQRVGAGPRGLALVQRVGARAVRGGLERVGVGDAVGADDDAGGVDEVVLRRRLRLRPGDDDGLRVRRLHVGDLARAARGERAVRLEGRRRCGGRGWP